MDVFTDVVFELKWLHFCGGKSRLIIRTEKSITDNIVVVLNEVTEAKTQSGTDSIRKSVAQVNLLKLRKIRSKLL